MAAESTARFPGGPGGGPGGGTRRERLARRRRALGLTQEDLAATLEVERTTVVRWERGETQPRPWLRPRLARALRLTADQLSEMLSADDPSEPEAAPESGRHGHRRAPVPRQLPPAIADFTGRGAELAELTGYLDAARSAPGTVVISAIGGAAGVGKTALALHWAHRVADRFGDGQLHVDLRGFDPAGAPVAPAEAVRGFLDALGVPPERVPPTPDAQAGLYRSLLADRKMLIVLDNARDEQHVRPLLPASPGSVVVITSRSQLAGLAAADGARLISLDVLSHREAVQFLTVRLGTDRTAADPAAVAEIAALCACLPLALSVAAARATIRPGLSLQALAAELRDTAARLDALDTGDPAASVRAVFSWSYEQLSPEVARMFRLLGLHPGPDITVPAAASLAACGRPAAGRLLRQLTRVHLITEHAPGRFSSHELLRAYAADKAPRTRRESSLELGSESGTEPDRESGRATAISRLLDHYLHSGYHAALILKDAGRGGIPIDPPLEGVLPERPADRQQALAWFDSEHLVMSAAINLATAAGDNRRAWMIAWTMINYLQLRRPGDELISGQHAALAARAKLADAGG